MKLKVTRDAERDLQAIGQFTLSQFGLQQWAAYEDGLKKSFANLTTNPRIGTDFSFVKKYTRRLIFQSHVIYYALKEDHILILRILSARQDPGRHL